MPDGPRTTRQNRAIHACRRSLDLSEQEYCNILAEFRILAAVDPDRKDRVITTSKDLSRSQARAILTRWQLRGAPVGGPYSGRKPDPTDGVIHLPTPAQQSQIRRLIEEIAWRVDNGYERWRRSRLHIPAVRTYQHAEAVIEGLKGLKKHGSARPAV